MVIPAKAENSVIAPQAFECIGFVVTIKRVTPGICAGGVFYACVVIGPGITAGQVLLPISQTEEDKCGKRTVRVIDRILAIAAIDNNGGIIQAGLQYVVAHAAMQCIPARARRQDVIAPAAIKRIVPRSAGQHVIAGIARQEIGTVPADQVQWRCTGQFELRGGK